VTVYLVGAGPGDPGLLTVRAAEVLRSADVVVHDRLADASLLDIAPAAARRVDVGKAPGGPVHQDEINALLVAEGQAGHTVVRLKGGDPFVFGRGGEEAQACRAAGVAFTVVPGITSAIAAPAYAGIPVTHRGLSTNFLVITASEAGEADTVDWDLAARADTLVILMGAATLAANMQKLLHAGTRAETQVACVRWGTRHDQAVARGTVATIADEVARLGLSAPLVTVVGAVAALAGELAWYEPGPLAGKRVAVTRARAQASDLAAQIGALGAEVVEAPAIRVELRPENLALESAGSRWDWVIFTSANGVQSFFQALCKLRRDARVLGTTRIAAVGAATAEELHANGVLPDFVPSKATSAALAEEIDGVRGARILLAVSNLTDSRLADSLRARGGLVEQVAAYETWPEPLDEALVAAVATADAVTFTSASTASNLKAALGATTLAAAARLVSIGPETSAAVVREFGRLDAEAASPSLAALVEATVEALRWV
jgi:uroporphyrinogen III methyltransferase/synthase